MAEPTRDLVERVTRVAAEVLLAATGRIHEPAPDEPLFGPDGLGPLDELHLVLTLQDEFGVVLDEEDVSDHDLVTVRHIAERLASKTS